MTDTQQQDANKFYPVPDTVAIALGELVLGVGDTGANIRTLAAFIQEQAAALDRAEQERAKLEAAQIALVNMVHDAEQECTRWQCVMEDVQDYITAPVGSDDYSTALSLIGEAVVDISFYELDDSDDEIAEHRAWILKRAQDAPAQP